MKFVTSFIFTATPLALLVLAVGSSIGWLIALGQLSLETCGGFCTPLQVMRLTGVWFITAVVLWGGFVAWMETFQGGGKDG